MLWLVRKILWFFLILLVIYFASIRLAIMAVQLYPYHVIHWLDQEAATQVSFQKLDIDQTWNGVFVQTRGLQVDHPEFELTVGQLVFDINLFAPFMPHVRLGDLVVAKDLYSQWSIKTDTTETPVNLPYSIDKIWDSVRLENAHFSILADKNYHVRIRKLNSYFGLNWTIGANWGVALDKQSFTDFQVIGELKPQGMGIGSVSGQVNLVTLNPIGFDHLTQWLPKAYQTLLPDGQLATDMALQVEASQVVGLEVSLVAEGLDWQVRHQQLPTSMGITLNWMSLPETDWQEKQWVFKVNEMRFDSHYLDDSSAIFAAIDQWGDITVFSQQLNYQLFKPFLEIYLPDNVSPIALSSLDFQLNDVKFSFDPQNLVITDFASQLQWLTWPEQNGLPGVSLKQLTIKKKAHDYHFAFSEPIYLEYQAYRYVEIPIQFLTDLHLKYQPETHHWRWQNFQVSFDQTPIEFSLQGVDTDLNLTLKASWKTVAQLKRQLPEFLLGDEVFQLLQTGLKKGKAIKLQFNLKGDVAQPEFFANPSTLGGYYQAQIDVKDAEFAFDPEWPSVKHFDAKLQFEPFQLRIEAPQAEIGSLQVKKVKVVLPNLMSDHPSLRVNGQVTTDVLQAQQFVFDTPIASLTGLDSVLTEQLTLQKGTVKVDLQNLTLPLSDASGEPKVEGLLNFMDTDLVLLDHLELSQVSGRLVFDEKGVDSNLLQGYFQQGPFQASLKTDRKTSDIRVVSQGQAQLYNDLIQGAVPWKTRVLISDLQGVEVNSEFDTTKAQSQLPAPLSEASLKAYSRPNAIRSHIKLKEGQLQLSVIAKGLARLVGEVDVNEGEVGNWLIQLGKEQDAVGVEGIKGVKVTGHLSEIYPLEWQAAWMKIQANLPAEWTSQNSMANSSLIWAPSLVLVDKLGVYESIYRNVQIEWAQLLNEDYQPFVVTIKNPELAIFVQEKEYNKFYVQLDRFKLKLPEEPEMPVAQREDKPNVQCLLPSSQRELPSLPDIEFVGQKVQLNDYKMEYLAFNLRDRADFMSLDSLEGSYGKKGRLKGSYVYFKKAHESRFKLDLLSKRAEDLVDLLALKKGIKGKKADVSLDLKWKGNYDCFSMQRVKGRLDFRIAEGEIRDAEPGIAKLIGLLSVESLARRLKLDLNDVTAKGLVFDELKGKGRFRKGVFGLEDLKLKAPSASAWMFGEVNLIEENLNLTADITPAIGSSLPAIAAISGLATPLAGLAAYALLKVVPVINEDLVTYRYEIKGSISDPSIKDKGLDLDLIKLPSKEVEFID